MAEEILTIQGLADYLQIDEKTAYRMAQGGELPGFKVRRQWRFKRADIDVWIDSRKKNVAAPSGASEPLGAQAGPIPTVSEHAPAKKRGRK
jgi:excisionase family DNA binding protein